MYKINNDSIKPTCTNNENGTYWFDNLPPKCTLGTCTEKCDENSECLFSNGKWTCLCKLGFVGNGTCCSKQIVNKVQYCIDNCKFKNNCEEINVSNKGMIFVGNQFAFSTPIRLFSKILLR